jgi:hypothetical protein
MASGGGNSSDTDFGSGKKIAQAPGLVSLCLNETVLSFKVPWMIEGGGEYFVFLRVVFEGICFSVEGQIEARADVVGFEVVVQGSYIFSAFRGFAH